eukprot:1434080-Ditylum_brightwellii.AAC.2
MPVSTQRLKYYVNHTHGSYTAHHKDPNSDCQFLPKEQQLSAPPTNAIFSPICHSATVVICLQHLAMILTPTQQQEITTLSFQDYINTYPAYMKHILGTLLEQDIDANYWITIISDIRVTITSDGLVKAGTGTFAVILKMDDQDLYFQGPVDCHQTLIESYQSKLTGILATYYILQCLKEYIQQSIQSDLVLHVDSISATAVNNIKEKYRGVTAHNRLDVDIIVEIEAMKALGLELKTKWVEAHQDTKYPSRSLLLPALLNCIVVADASSYMEGAHTPSSTTPIFSSSHATFKCGDVIVTRGLQKIIWDSCSC